MMGSVPVPKSRGVMMVVGVVILARRWTSSVEQQQLKALIEFRRSSGLFQRQVLLLLSLPLSLLSLPPKEKWPH